MTATKDVLDYWGKETNRILREENDRLRAELAAAKDKLERLKTAARGIISQDGDLKADWSNDVDEFKAALADLDKEPK